MLFKINDGFEMQVRLKICCRNRYCAIPDRLNTRFMCSIQIPGCSCLRWRCVCQAAPGSTWGIICQKHYGITFCWQFKTICVKRGGLINAQLWKKIWGPIRVRSQIAVIRIADSSTNVSYESYEVSGSCCGQQPLCRQSGFWSKEKTPNFLFRNW